MNFIYKIIFYLNNENFNYNMTYKFLKSSTSRCYIMVLMDTIFQHIDIYMMIIFYLLSKFKNTAGGAALSSFPQKKKSVVV